MSRIAFENPLSIGALLDLGLDFDYLKSELKKLPVDGYELGASRVTRSNLSAMKFDVLMEQEKHGHHHDHEHDHHHGHSQSHDHTPAQNHAHEATEPRRR